jgi:hypothetical protein
MKPIKKAIWFNREDENYHIIRRITGAKNTGLIMDKLVWAIEEDINGETITFLWRILNEKAQNLYESFKTRD